MRRNAFTLMELLVVISIIMILMGMLFAGITIAKKAILKAKTTSAISKLQAELANFKQLNGRYPEADPASTAANPAPTWMTIFTTPPVAFSAIGSGTWAQANAQLVSELKNAGAPIDGATVVDGWKQVLHYRPARYYPYTSGSTVYIDGEDPPNRDSYQLWSTGPDLIDQGGAVASDDLTTWEKR